MEVATGILAAELGLDVEEADRRLRDSASRAGVTAVDLARAILDAHHRRGRRDD